ncbi:MAG: hypothetical protein GKR95_22135 [Gammaproteobacteria bacterium]|nr:hypothetical protein [Gammaproteobacteria bacterium]
MNEKISALIDGDLNTEDRGSQLSKILSDEQATQSWRRYHLIGNVIRNEVESSGRDLSADIWSKLEQEPTVLTPSPKRKVEKGASDIWPAAGLIAMAASIALAAVVALGPLGDNDSSGQIAFNKFVETTVAGPSEDQKRITDEFGEMLAEHGEFSSSAGLNGLVAYAKLVSNQSMDH